MSIIEEIHKNAQEINNFPQQKVYNWANKANGEYNSSIDYLKEYNPKLLEKMFKLLPKEPTRDDVKRCYREDLYLGFIATLLWGGFNRDPKTIKYFKQLCTLPRQGGMDVDSIEKMCNRLETIDRLFSNNTLGYIFEQASNGKIAKGISYSYASKIIYFLGYGKNIPIKPIVYDSWMHYAHCALLIESEPPTTVRNYFCYKLNPKTNNYYLDWTRMVSPGSRYNDFCKRLNNDFADCVAEPDHLEAWLFSEKIRVEYCQIVDSFFLGRKIN